MGAWRRWQAGVQELPGGKGPVGEEGSQLAGGGDMGAWRRWQAGVQELPGGKGPVGEEGSQLAGGGDGRWARCQLASRSGRHEKIKVVLRPGPGGGSIKRRPGTRVKVPEPCLEAI
jgi:hypothetical protein